MKMKRTTSYIAYSFLVCCLFLAVSCKKNDLPEKPEAGSFSVSSTIANRVPAAGATYTLTIEGTTNGWWIEVENEDNWVTIPRKYGSATANQEVTIAPNTSGQNRETGIILHSTGGQNETIRIHQEK